MAATITCQQVISPIDALWALYQSQTKRVRKAFRSRLLAEDMADKKNMEMREYERKLPPEVRKSVSMMAYAVKQGVADVHHAAANHTHVGRNADDFLAELEQEEV